MTIAELIELLQEVPADWEVFGTHSGSLEAREPGGYRRGQKYCYVYPDGRATRHYTAQR